MQIATPLLLFFAVRAPAEMGSPLRPYQAGLERGKISGREPHQLGQASAADANEEAARNSVVDFSSCLIARLDNIMPQIPTKCQEMIKGQLVLG